MSDLNNLDLFNSTDLCLFKNNYKNINFETYKNYNIFCNNYISYKLDNYNYIKVNDDEEIYYLNLHFLNNPIFINQKKQIFLFSFQLFKNIHHIVNNLEYILSVIKSINFDDISENNILNINKNIQMVQKFNTLYGHYKDEIFCLHEFTNKYNNLYPLDNYIPLIEYNNLKENNNYGLLQNMLFDDKCINPYIYGKKILKFKKLIMIEHNYTLDTFHSFPLYTRNYILSKISDFKNNKNVFIVRNQSIHTNRLINNFKETIDIFTTNNFLIINPENMSLFDLIKEISRSEKIIITWGSALVNLIYTTNKNKIYIIKSNSYKNEGIGIFRNLIKNHNLNITILECDDDNNFSETNAYKIINNF
jgi:hypothetical protein